MMSHVVCTRKNLNIFVTNYILYKERKCCVPLILIFNAKHIWLWVVKILPVLVVISIALDFFQWAIWDWMGYPQNADVLFFIVV